MPDVCLIKKDTKPEDISTTSESFVGGILPFSAFSQHTKLNEVCGIIIVNLVTSLIGSSQSIMVQMYLNGLNDFLRLNQRSFENNHWQYGLSNLSTKIIIEVTNQEELVEKG